MNFQLILGLAALGAADQSQCDPNTEQWNDCGSQCAERVCCESDPKGHCKDKNCPEECTPMCECIKGFARHPDGVMCIDKNDCLGSFAAPTTPLTVGAANGGAGSIGGGVSGTNGADVCNHDCQDASNKGTCNLAFCTSLPENLVTCTCDISSDGVTWEISPDRPPHLWAAYQWDDGSYLYGVHISIDNTALPKATVQEWFKYNQYYFKGCLVTPRLDAPLVHPTLVTLRHFWVKSFGTV